MGHSSLIARGLAVCLGVGLALSPATALADSLGQSDPADDVQVTVDGDDYSPADRPTVDLVDSHFTHSAKRVVATATVTDLVAGRQELTLLVKTGTKASARFSVNGVVTTAGETWVSVQSARGAVSCPRARFKVDTSTDTMRLAVPRRCLGTPAWVKLAEIAQTRSGDQYYLDYGGLDHYPTATRPYTAKIPAG